MDKLLYTPQKQKNMNKKIVLPILSGSFLSDGSPKGLATSDFFTSHLPSHSSLIASRRYYYVLGDPDLPTYSSRLVNAIQFKDNIKELVKSITSHRSLTRLINK